MYIRLRWRQAGGHAHVRVFMGRDADHLAKCGDLAFREDERDREWTAFRNRVIDGSGAALDIVDETSVDSPDIRTEW